MKPARRRTGSSRMRVLVVVLALAVLLAGCSNDEPAPAPDPAPVPSAAPPSSAAPPPSPPRAGACYDLTFRQAAAPTSAGPAVPCAGPHTAVSIHVGHLNPVEDGHLVAIDSRRVQQAIARTCARQLAGHLGGGTEARRLSRFETVWFTPTLQAVDRGASWYRCDLVLLAGRNQLGQLPRHTRGILAGQGVLDRYGTCANASPAAAHFVRVVCSRKHAWRVAASIDLAPGAKYLGKPAAAAADQRCREIASDRAGFDLEFTWSFEWPTRKQWDAGQRWGYCWLPTP